MRARQALSFAIDRRRLVALVGKQGAVTCQILPPNFDAYARYCPFTAGPTAGGVWSAPDLARARRLVTVLIPTFFAFTDAPGRYVASVLRSIGYRAQYGGRVDFNKINAGAGNVSFNGWFADFLAPAGFLVGTDNCAENVVAPHSTVGATCIPAIDREFERARAQQVTDPEQATLLWRKVDRDTTDAAPWVAYLNPGKLELLSSRVGNYQYSPQWGTLFDQLWVK